MRATCTTQANSQGTGSQRKSSGGNGARIFHCKVPAGPREPPFEGEPISTGDTAVDIGLYLRA
jgi:hypothetical protein